jgi:hypothetical protein
MTTVHTEERRAAESAEAPSLTGAHRRTLEAIFRHPLAHNLEWREVVHLMDQLGASHEKSNSEFVFEVGGERQLIRRPHGKDLTTDEVLEFRHFLERAGCSPDHPPEAAPHPVPPAPDLLIVVDHHETRIFHVDLGADAGEEPVIRPYDPHHFLHHLTHKDQDRERGQRAPEEPAYYERVAQAVAQGGKIVVIGHGEGHSNAADHLTQFLKTHHNETYGRIVRELHADLSALSPPQLLVLARRALRP